MRHLNLKFLIQLAIGAAILAAGVPLLHAFNVGRSGKVLLSKAEEAAKNHRLRDAQRYYLEYLRNEPGDDNARAQHALVAAEITRLPDVRSGDVSLAYISLEQALRQNGLRQRDDLRRKLIDVQVLRGMVDEARKNIDLLSASSAGKTDPELDYLYARCAYATKNYDQALTKLTRLVGYDRNTRTFDVKKATAPNNIGAYVLLASILREQKELVREADAIMDQLVAVNPKSPQALIQRGDYLVRWQRDGNATEARRRRDAAQEDLRAALKLDPDNIDALMQNADLCAMNNDYDAAVKHLERARQLSPKDERIYLQTGRLLLVQKKQPQAAIDIINKGLVELPTSTELICALHEFQLQAGNVADARKTIDRMNEARIQPERIALAKARISMVEGKWGVAAQQLEDVRPQLEALRKQNPKYDNLALSADLSLAKCYGMQRQLDRQLVAFARILAVYPRNIDALRGKAASLHLLGRLDESLETYQKGLARAMGAEAFIADKNLMRAYVSLLAAMVRRDPENLSLANTLKMARGYLEDPAEPAAPNLQTVVGSIDDNKPEQAKKALLDMIKEHPKDLRLQLALVSVMTSSQGPAAGLTQLDEVEKQFGSTAQIIAVRHELLVRKGGYGAKAGLAATEPAIEKLTKEEQVATWTRLGGYYYRLGDLGRDDVRRCWKRAAEMQPGNTTLLESLFELAREKNDHLEMLKARDAIEKSAGRDSATWKYVEAARLVSQAREKSLRGNVTALDEARQLLQKASEDRRDWYRLIRLQAEISEMKNDPDSAMRDYQRSLDLGPADYTTVSKLVQLYLTQNRIDDARKALHRLGENAAGMERAQALVEVLSPRPDKAKALAAIQRAVPDDAKNPQDFLWKGRLLMQIGQKVEAEAALRRATELGSDQPETWRALVQFLVEAGKAEQAEQVIRSAENELAEDQVAMTLGACYAILGSYDQAEHYYLLALSAESDSVSLMRTVAAFYLGARQPTRAATYLNSILSTAPRMRQDEIPHLVWARRQIAGLLANSPSYTQFQLAIRLVEANAVAGEIGAEDKALLARLYGQRRDAASLRRAIELLDDLKKSKSLSMEDQLLMAQLYVAIHQLDLAKSLLVNLAAEQRDNPRILAALAGTLLKRHEPRSAAPWVRALQELQPNNDQTIALSCELAAQMNDPERAEALVNSVMPQKIGPGDLNRVLAGGRLLEQVKQYPAAERKYRQFAAAAPDGWIELAGYLARRGNIDDTYSLIQAKVSDATLPQIAPIALVALRSRKQSGKTFSPAQSAQALAWFEQAERKGGITAALELERAGLLELLDRPQEALQAYQTVLASAKLPDLNRAMVSNNLAFLLAVQGIDLGTAQRLIDQAIQLLGPLPELRDTQAMVAMAKGDPQEAEKILLDATTYGGTPEMFLHLAVAQQQKKDRTAAGQTFERAKVEGLRKELLSRHDAQKLDKLAAWLKS